MENLDVHAPLPLKAHILYPPWQVALQLPLDRGSQSGACSGGAGADTSMDMDTSDDMSDEFEFEFSASRVSPVVSQPTCGSCAAGAATA